jgi:hypothetical protein
MSVSVDGVVFFFMSALHKFVVCLNFARSYGKDVGVLLFTLLKIAFWFVVSWWMQRNNIFIKV